VFKAPRGLNDILPKDQPAWSYIETQSSATFESFGYRRIDTPVFEESGLYDRSVGQATDIVEKETYRFEDRSGDSMTLRPEGTAGVCRAYLEHGMRVLPQPVRLYSVRMPMFRYDRPQAGRQRQHHQIWAEAIGDAHASVDGEVVEMAWRLLERLGLRDLTLALNSIGDPVCRPDYVAALRGYYQPLLPKLCADCQRRFETNALRLLDCKKASCAPYAEQAPHSIDSLCGECGEHWRQLTQHLKAMGIEYTVKHRLVRGLDYYTRTVFEIVPPEEGAQSTLGGGGRYDGLIEQLGGRPTPGVGFAAGVERILLNLRRQGVAIPDGPSIDAVIVHLGADALTPALSLASDLRRKGLAVVVAPVGKSLKAQMRYAGSRSPSYTLILGEDEVREGAVAVNRMDTGDQQKVPFAQVAEVIST